MPGKLDGGPGPWAGLARLADMRGAPPPGTILTAKPFAVRATVPPHPVLPSPGTQALQRPSGLQTPRRQAPGPPAHETLMTEASARTARIGTPGGGPTGTGVYLAAAASSVAPRTHV